MKFLLLALLCGFACMGQKIRFEYDGSGSQKLRTYCINCASRMADPAPDPSTLKDEELARFEPDDAFSYYPNPVREELYLRWTTAEGRPSVKSLDVFSVSGQRLRSIPDIAGNEQSISFLDYPAGMYLIALRYSDGSERTIRIVKQ